MRPVNDRADEVELAQDAASKEGSLRVMIDVF